MAKVIIFGFKEFAEIAHYYLTEDSDHEVVAFCVNEQYMSDLKHFKSLPIVPFEKVESLYPKNEFQFLAPMTSRQMNVLREKVYNSIKEKGYKCISYISSKAVTNNAEIGDNCFILEGTMIQPYCKIGNNVMISANCYIGHHAEVKDHVTISGQVAIEGSTVIGENSFLGVHSTIRNRMVLAKGTLVGMSSSIISNTINEWSVYMGNPAKEIGKNISKAINKG